MQKLFIVIPSNRFEKLHPKTVAVIEKTKTKTIFIKQNLSPYYQNHQFIKEIISHQTGVSKARNLGIKFALKQKADIIAFTDDDCIITEKWIKNIYQTLKDPKKDIVFGRTLPFQPQKHLSEYCPSTFSKKSQKPILGPVSVCREVGMGNNFAVTPKLISHVGFFSLFLGPGTRIPGGEDPDYIIRIINNKFPIYYNHRALIYHDKWLSQTNLQHLYQKYTLAIAYVYAYHAFHTNTAYFKILFQEFSKEFFVYFRYLKQIIHPFSFLKLIHNHNLIIFSFLKGFSLSLIYP